MRVAGWLSVVPEILLPTPCAACSEPLPGTARALCPTCAAALVPLAGPRCPRCAGPADGADEACLACQAAEPPQLATVAWGEYDGTLRKALLALKHSGRDELARPLGRRLAARLAAEPWATRLDMVSPVPSHPLRRFRRPWTAAALLAAEVGRELRLPLRPGLRRRGLGRQAVRTRAARLELPRRAFAARRSVAGRRVLLVDDVCTTGTTLRRAAAALLAAGADAVYCAALAWTPDARRLS